MKILHLTIAAAAVAFSMAASAESMAPAPTPKGTHLGNVIVNPYGYSPLTAVINRNTKQPTDIKVTVKGKPNGGIDITYDVGRSTLLSNDGIPVFGLYPDYRNTVVVSYKLDGKKITDTYSIITPALTMPYMDNRNITALPQPKVTKLDPKFKNRLYLVNSGTRPPKGSEVNWIMPKTPKMSKSAANPSGGSLAFETIPLNYVVDTNPKPSTTASTTTLPIAVTRWASSRPRQAPTRLCRVSAGSNSIWQAALLRSISFRRVTSI